MELLLTAMDEMATFLLTTPFALPLAVVAFSGGCWVLAVSLSKAQEMGQ